MILDFLRLSKALSFVLISSESFLKILMCSVMFWGCLEVISLTASDSVMFLKVLRRSLTF